MPSCPIDSITILSDRQRRDPGDLTSLTESIRLRGLLHPIILDRNHTLRAGFRRLSAARALGWTSIEFNYVDTLDPLELEAIELEENTRRKNLSWQEENDAVARMAQIYRQLHPEEKTAQIADRIGLSADTVQRHIQVRQERDKNPDLDRAATFKTARARTAAALERRAAAETDEHIGSGPDCTSVLNTSFHDWASLYSGPKFNLIHCDFPYGIDAQASGSNPAGYDDRLSVYLHLLKTLAVHLDNFCAPAAHMIFWFSPIHYSLTWENLKLLDGFTFDEVPLIWHKSDGRGIAPDPYRRPRRVYETAFFGWRGDAKLVHLRDNVASFPTTRLIHAHEKSELALQHFFSMVVDKTTRLLDPTCGSGSALRAARSLGAANVLGLEISPDFAKAASDSLLRGERDTDEDLPETC